MASENGKMSNDVTANRTPQPTHLVVPQPKFLWKTISLVKFVYKNLDFHKKTLILPYPTLTGELY